MNIFALLLFAFAGPFWQEKPADQWTDIELAQFFVDSPWAQNVPPPRAPNAPPIQVYIATASPVVAAEKERDRRLKLRHKPGEPEKEDPLADEYRLWLEDNRASQIVLAVRMGATTALSQEAEVRHMEEESTMQIGHKKVKLTGHFPPTATDRYLRFAFPRQEAGDEKTVTFSVYVPGLPLPFREIQFRLKDLAVNGKPEL
jgi:hypothetical protein